MGARSGTRRRKQKQAVLAELARLAEGRHPRNQTLMARFARCRELQSLPVTLARAVEARTPRRQRHTARPTPRMAATAELMASGRQLLIPHLDGIPVAHHFHAGERASIRLAQVLVDLEIADPADWRRVRRDPRNYVQATLNRWIDLHGGRVIRRRFNLGLTLSESLESYAEPGEDDPDGRQLYMVLQPDSAAYVVAGPTLELLER